MAKINLLPWRLERRKQKQTEFITWIGFAAIAAILISLLGYMYYDGRIETQLMRNELLNTRIAEVKKENEQIAELETRRASLLQRKEVIEGLQADRTQNVRLFDELVKSIPDGVRLSSITQNGTVLMLDGRSQSFARVSSYMRNLETSGWITAPVLSLIEAKGEDRSLPFQFTIQATLTTPDANKAEGEEDTTTTVTAGLANASGSAVDRRASQEGGPV